MSVPLLRIDNVSKAYGGVHALKRVSLDLERGEIHALCGENGAGKSTLIKILAGVIAPDEGSVSMDGSTLELGKVAASENAGVAVIHQEPSAFPDLTALDNIFVGREPRTAGGLFLDKTRMRKEAESLLARLKQRIELDRPVGRLSFAQRQMTAMARALNQNCRLLILDEPTASLSARETETLLQVVRTLRDEGVTILYVSHRLEEIFGLADRVTVLRDGERVGTKPVEELNRESLIRLMAGREMEELTQRHEHEGSIGEARLEVRGLSSPGVFEDVSFTVRAGEIVGLAGLVGAGRTELARAVFGLDRCAGEVIVDGRLLKGGSVKEAMRAGVALVPEDRQLEGLVLPMSVGANLSMSILSELTRFGFVRRQSERETIRRLMEELSVKAAHPDIAAETLSGGNQQKLVLGKWLATRPKVLILDEPTRGVDVGAKAQAHRLIRELAAKGLATLMISSDMTEVLSCSDRILVMSEGRISGELAGRTATQEKVLELALP